MIEPITLTIETVGGVVQEFAGDVEVRVIILGRDTGKVETIDVLLSQLVAHALASRPPDPRLN